MAKIEFLSGQTITDIPSIQQILAPIQVQLSFWTIQGKMLKYYYKQSQLQEEEKETVRQKHMICTSKVFKRKKGYQHRDLIVLHPDISQSRYASRKVLTHSYP